MLLSNVNNTLITLNSLIVKRMLSTQTVYPQEITLIYQRIQAALTGHLRYGPLCLSVILLDCPGPALSPVLKPHQYAGKESPNQEAKSLLGVGVS